MGELSQARSYGTGEACSSFSNRLGCLGSLLVSGLITLALLFMFGIVRF